MNIQSINSLNFGYSHNLKTLWKKGKFPTVKKGFYGDELTLTNVSLEHLKPHSKGGKTELDNLVLATRQNNSKRSNLPIIGFANIDNIKVYLEQFRGIKNKKFNGNQYITLIKQTLGKMGVFI